MFDSRFVDLEERIRSYQTILEKEPDNILVRRLLAFTYMKGGDFFKAINNFRMLLKRGNESLDNVVGTRGWTHYDDRVCLGWSLLELGMYDEAMDLLTNVRRECCWNPFVFLALGKYYYMIGKLNKDYDSFRLAIGYFDDTIRTGLSYLGKPEYKNKCSELRLIVESSIVGAYELLIKSSLLTNRPIKALKAWLGFNFYKYYLKVN